LHHGALALDHRGARLPVIERDERLACLAQLIELPSLQIVHSFLRSGPPLIAASFDPSYRRVLTVNNDGTLRFWDVKSGKKTVEFQWGTSNFTTAMFSPDARFLVSGSEDGTAILWDTLSGLALASLRHPAGVSAVAFSPDGQLLVTGDEIGNAILWDARTGQVVAHLKGHTASVSAITFSADANFIITGSADKTAWIWDGTCLEKEQKKLTGHLSGIRAIAISLRNYESSIVQRINIIDFHGNAYIWNLQDLRIIVANANAGESDGYTSFGLDGAFAAISMGGELRIWDAEAARTLDILRARESSRVSVMGWSGTRLLVGDHAGVLSVYDVRELTLTISELADLACSKYNDFSSRFSWMESATDPLIRELWDPESIVRSVCSE